MQNIWKSILEEENIKTTEKFNEEECIASPLTNFAILEISGNDRYSFLQNQFTNDLEKNNLSSQISAWCTPKGRVITNFIIINIGSSYLLIFKENLKDYIFDKLNMFILRSEVTITDASNLYLLIGLHNISKLEFNNFSISLNEGDVEFINKSYITKLMDSSGRYLIAADSQSIKSVINELRDKVEFASISVWELLDILFRIPWINTENKEKYLPQMLNLDILNAISYTKGCYTGQEVIARLHHRGKVKRRLQLIKSRCKLHTGDILYLQNSKEKVGEVLNSSCQNNDHFFGLAIIECDKLEFDLYKDKISKENIDIIH